MNTLQPSYHYKARLHKLDFGVSVGDRFEYNFYHCANGFFGAARRVKAPRNMSPIVVALGCNIRFLSSVPCSDNYHYHCKARTRESTSDGSREN